MCPNGHILDKEEHMATVSPDELLRLWSREELTSDMAIGHVLQNMVQQQTILFGLQSTIATLRADIERAASPLPTDAEPPTKRHRRSPKRS